jgi:hypothetical protein
MLGNRGADAEAVRAQWLSTLDAAAIRNWTISQLPRPIRISGSAPVESQVPAMRLKPLALSRAPEAGGHQTARSCCSACAGAEVA